MNTQQVLLAKQDDIIQRWMRRVRQDRQIESNCSLSYTETLDSLPEVIEAIAQTLSEPDAADMAQLLSEGHGHGKIRAKQGYDAAEIVREYAILREIIIEMFSQDMGQADSDEIFALVSSTNSAIDKVIAASMKRYADERLYELNILYDELINSNRELDRIVRSEQSNLAHLAHELKSPLSSIIGYSELFLTRQVKEGAIHPEYIEQALSSGRQLLRTINDALEMSSYRSGKVSLAPQLVDACEVISEVCTALRIMAQQKGLILSEQCDRNEIYITTDKVRLRQVVTNLLSNAIRYTDAGSILVATRLLEGDRIEIEVKDTGCGIDAAEQGLIFEPYYQGEAGQQLQSSTGLGLAITNQVVRLLQGSIQLKSEPKVGSTFTISLPLKLETSSSPKPSTKREPSSSEQEFAEAKQQTASLQPSREIATQPSKL